ncbi:hypothetical protein EV644_11151 [Kribbella orskensis]|uniref:Amidohydrolase family protein n=1 Tax=Kribbella orskensis TaxID=2512216 RepID=A0ABY2BGA2_9ACTN|nr:MULTISPECIES: hypothetical protein [Kribbella]TCN37685.1 hypothetical protein EV642_111214 [Kribbella sp. VKM Ac-2500]TCO18813.1 hypothetical protein EV644_11151 [Kribbella orskensis]
MAPRKIADLVVLDADRLADIRNTRTIHMVITRGRVISPAVRERMPTDVEASLVRPLRRSAQAAAAELVVLPDYAARRPAHQERAASTDLRPAG